MLADVAVAGTMLHTIIVAILCLRAPPSYRQPKSGPNSNDDGATALPATRKTGSAGSGWFRFELQTAGIYALKRPLMKPGEQNT
tara:strand:+ start:25589 stop:25840 length:252 start_codon:yes stop_codon:yes gene_type:complete